MDGGVVAPYNGFSVNSSIVGTSTKVTSRELSAAAKADGFDQSRVCSQKAPQ